MRKAKVIKKPRDADKTYIAIIVANIAGKDFSFRFPVLPEVRDGWVDHAPGTKAHDDAFRQIEKEVKRRYLRVHNIVIGKKFDPGKGDLTATFVTRHFGAFVEQGSLF